MDTSAAAAAAQARLAGLLPDTLGIELTSVSAESVVATLTVREGICTSGSILHGGAVMAFADTLGAVATVMNLPEGAGTTTLESKTNFFRAAPAGTTVTGTCTPLHRGRSTMVWQTRIEDAEQRLVALVTQTQMVLAPR